MAVSNADRLKAAAIQAAIRLYTGSDALKRETANQIIITPTPEQAKILRQVLEDFWNSPPGGVTVDVKPVLIPFALRQAAPYLIGGAAIGALYLYFKR